MKAPKGSGGTFEKHPEGQTTLVCTKIVDKGTVWNEKKQKDERKISFVFESQKLMSEGEYAGKPFLVFQNFNFSMFQNSMLCKFIEQWRGKRFATQAEADAYDLVDRLGTGAFVNISHNEDFVNITSIMPIPAGMTQPIPVGDMLIWSFDEPKMAVFEKLSDKMKESLKRAKEWATMNDVKPQNPVAKPANGGGPDFQDDVPFGPVLSYP